MYNLKKSFSPLEGSDGRHGAGDGIVALKSEGKEDGGGEGNIVFCGALLVGLRGRAGLRPVGPIKEVQQGLVVPEPVRVKPVRVREHLRVPHHQLLEPAEQLALLHLEGRLVGPEQEVAAGPPELERHGRVVPEGLVDHRVDQLEVFDRVEGDWSVQRPDLADEAAL